MRWVDAEVDGALVVVRLGDWLAVVVAACVVVAVVIAVDVGAFVFAAVAVH